MARSLENAAREADHLNVYAGGGRLSHLLRAVIGHLQRAGMIEEPKKPLSTSAWRCPKCHSDNLDIEIVTWARLNQNPGCPDDFSTDADDGQNGDHEWDGDSGMQCRDCGHTAKVIDFEADIYECQNCGQGWTLEELKTPIPDLEKRVEPGEPMPAGECPDPECGALCHKKEGEKSE